MIDEEILRKMFEADYSPLSRGKDIFARKPSGNYKDPCVFSGWRMYRACVNRLFGQKPLVWYAIDNKYLYADCAFGRFLIHTVRGGILATLVVSAPAPVVISKNCTGVDEAKALCRDYKVKLLIEEMGGGCNELANAITN